MVFEVTRHGASNGDMDLFSLGLIPKELTKAGKRQRFVMGK